VFRIKICGVRSREDATAAAEAGADGVGLNFYPQSPRFISRETAQKALTGQVGVEAVGVFVNSLPETIQSIATAIGLTAIQLHGDEPPESLVALPGLPVILARRLDDRGVAAIAEDLEACRAAGRLPDAVLVDALTPGRFGGTGETASWAGLADYRQWLGEMPLILAGGLTPENVAEAIRIVRPFGVDVASGVESSPGVKDHDKIRRFVEAAREAFAEAD
jgi:phosphoribosylanthranilate isomerase